MNAKIGGGPRAVVSGSTLIVGKDAKAADVQGKADAKIGALAGDNAVDKLGKELEARGLTAEIPFGNSLVGVDAAAKIFRRLLQHDPADIVGITQFVAALGIQVGYQGTGYSNFTGVSHDLALVPFPKNKPANLMPTYEHILTLSSQTKRLAIALKKDSGPDALREAKQKAVFMAHELLGIWVRAGTIADGGKDLAASALQALKNCAELQGRIQFAMQDFVENTKRGMGLPTEQPEPVMAKGGELIFTNTLRGPKLDDPALRAQEIGKKVSKFINEKGGKFTDVERLTPDFLAKAPHGARAEFVLVVQPDAVNTNDLRVTLNEGAGHSIIAGVRPEEAASFTPNMVTDEKAKTAGGFRIAKRADGEVMIFADPKSGHYRAPKQFLEALVQHFEAAGVPKNNIIPTAGDPLDTGEILAIDVWKYKRDNGGNLPKDVGNKFYDDSVALFEKAKSDGAAVVEKLLGGVK